MTHRAYSFLIVFVRLPHILDTGWTEGLMGGTQSTRRSTRFSHSTQQAESPRQAVLPRNRHQRGIRMPRAFVVTLGILVVASLVIVPKFVSGRSQHTKAENTQAETCDLIVAGSTRYVPPC